ncbi:hypothetical protein [Pseudomonas sp. SBT1-2]|uniref:hypothetical protein n=1 Tax=Pseudomonas sp. SBT1-2 TaxID=3027852 RepID=UPI0023614A1F|nr:hypothetical protein [Pseudomonas sp. SBT1-2]
MLYVRLSLLMGSLLAATTATAADWLLDPPREDGEAAAFTTDAQGNKFGVACYKFSGECFWELRPKLECPTTDELKLAIESGGQWLPSEGACLAADEDGPSFMLLTDFEQIAAIVQKDRTISIRSELQPQINSGPFDVAGAMQALEKVSAINEGSPSPPIAAKYGIGIESDPGPAAPRPGTP